MFERDYLMVLLQNFFAAIVRSMQQASLRKDPAQAAETIEQAIGEATELDPTALLSLAPESMASIMQVSGIDQGLAGYIAHSLLLESQYLHKAQNAELAQLRERQALALADAYGYELSGDSADEFCKQIDESVESVESK
jgi:hypothetical protein